MSEAGTLAADGIVINLGYVIGFLLGSLAIGIASGVVTALVSNKGHGENIKTLFKGLANLDARAQKLDDFIEEVSRERMQCALAAAREYATHAEVVQAIVDSAEHASRIHQRLDDLHEKINPLMAKVGGLLQCRGKEPVT